MQGLREPGCSPGNGLQEAYEALDRSCEMARPGLRKNAPSPRTSPRTPPTRRLVASSKQSNPGKQTAYSIFRHIE